MSQVSLDPARSARSFVAGISRQVKCPERKSSNDLSLAQGTQVMTRPDQISPPRFSRGWSSLHYALIGFVLAVPFDGRLEVSAAQPAKRLPSENLLVFRTEVGAVADVKTPADWMRRRMEIVRSMLEIMGDLPGDEKRCPLEMKVESERDCGSYLRQLISYASEPGSRVPAYLLVPKSVLSDTSMRTPAVLCLHPTDQKVGHGVVVGEGTTNPRSANSLA